MYSYVYCLQLSRIYDRPTMCRAWTKSFPQCTACQPLPGLKFKLPSLDECGGSSSSSIYCNATNAQTREHLRRTSLVCDSAAAAADMCMVAFSCHYVGCNIPTPTRILTEMSIGRMPGSSSSISCFALTICDVLVYVKLTARGNNFTFQPTDENESSCQE